MALLDMNELVQQYALRSGILGQNGQMTQPQQQQPQGLLQSPALGQALLSAASTMALANERGMGLGSALAFGANQFGGTIQAEKLRQEEAQKEATNSQLAAIKDIINLKTAQEELALRMQEAALRRRALNNSLSSDAAEKAQKAAQRQAILESGDENLIKLLNMGGLDAVQSYLPDSLKPKTPNTEGLPDGYMWNGTGQAVPIPGIGSGAFVDPEATVPGFGPAQGATPTAEDAKELKKSNAAAQNIQSLLEQRKAIVEGNGRIFAGEPAARDLDTNTSLLQLEIKNAAQTGALDKGTIEVLEKTILNPTIGTLSDAISPIALGSKIWQGKDYATKNIDTLENYVNTGIQNQAAARGYQAKRPDATIGMHPVPQFDPALLEHMTPEERALFQ